MPKDLTIATAQFESRSGDKQFNLAAINALAVLAAQSGADVIAFHECSVTGYSFGISVLAGLFERGADGAIYKAHVCIDGNGVQAKYRKIHPFINPNIMPGTE